MLLPRRPRQEVLSLKVYKHDHLWPRAAPGQPGRAKTRYSEPAPSTRTLEPLEGC